MMCLASGPGLEQAIAEADDAMPPEGLPVASERAGGGSRISKYIQNIKSYQKLPKKINFPFIDLKSSSLSKII